MTAPKPTDDGMERGWRMLSPPRNGWTRFRLEGFGCGYGLSDMWAEDIAFEWIDHAICGLETLSPFCVKGSLEQEPERMLCVVNTENCRVLVDYRGGGRLGREALHAKASQVAVGGYSPTTMVEFCRYLYEDVSADIDGWVDWVSCRDREERRRQLVGKLAKLKGHIEYYGEELF